jgi:hypothetical protein
MPVRIQRDAFGTGMPHRDLLLSPDHAVFVDGLLVCARQLVNGTTIRQESDWLSVEYHHVELDQHSVILAEGLPAESYLNTGNKGFFQNSGEPLLLHPSLTDDADLPSREAGSCAPLVWEASRVEPIWRRLADRAAALGQPVPTPELTTEPELGLLAKGRKIHSIYSKGGLHIFPLPRGAGEIHLVSRAGSPTDARPWMEDRRHLGVRVTRLVLRSAGQVRDIALDDPALAQGWWDVERDAMVMRRWTDGEAVLPLPALSGPTILEVHVSEEMRYVVAPEIDTIAEEGRLAA